MQGSHVFGSVRRGGNISFLDEEKKEKKRKRKRKRKGKGK